MHTLHRLHLAQAMAIAAACAAVALLLTLLMASTLNDFGSATTFGSPAAAPASVRATSTQPGWNMDPFGSLLRRPAASPWSA